MLFLLLHKHGTAVLKVTKLTIQYVGVSFGLVRGHRTPEGTPSG